MPGWEPGPQKCPAGSREFREKWARGGCCVRCVRRPGRLGHTLSVDVVGSAGPSSIIGHQDLVLQGWVGRAVACLVCRSENRPKKGTGTSSAGVPVTVGTVS